MSDRREFLKTGAVAAAVAAIPTAVHAAGNDQIKVGLIGCGGRGSGAIRDSLKSDPAVKVHALGDCFLPKAQNQAKALASEYKDRVDVGDRVFGGLDAYQKVIDSGADLIILATPPGFRPYHLEAAVKAKKHIFCEKPVAVDGPGIRKCLELVDQIKANGTALVAGTQRRHQAGYIETINRIKDGAIGEVLNARCAWNGQGIWFNPRRAGETDAQYQLRNWYHFLWLCGDHIVEQHVHNLDVVNWVMGGHPVRAMGLGSRSQRPAGPPAEAGHIYDQFAVEYEYADGRRCFSYCRHIADSTTDISETVFGSKGNSRVNAYMIGKEKVFNGNETNPYVQEHIDLIASIRAGKPLNELQAVTESTMTAILGREAAYTGKVLRWDDVLKSRTVTMPPDLTMESAIQVGPVPVPGKYKLA